MCICYKYYIYLGTEPNRLKHYRRAQNVTRMPLMETRQNEKTEEKKEGKKKTSEKSGRWEVWPL